VKTKYKVFKCKKCGKRCRVWEESMSAKEKLCADCLKKKHNFPI